MSDLTCLLTFPMPAIDPSTGSTYDRTVDLLSLGSFDWSRAINMNSIYIPLPTKAEDDGGYGYDLGFLQDDITFNIDTRNHEETMRLIALCKTNTGQHTGELTFGFTGKLHTYYVLIRNINTSGNSGGILDKITITVTVLSKEFT